MPEFQEQFPHLNYKSFKENTIYWLHWVRKMDPRERLHFKEWNPIILISEDEWLHLDLSRKEIPIIDYSFYWPDEEWLATNIFDSLHKLHDYLYAKDVSAKEFIAMAKRITYTETFARTRSRINKNNPEDTTFSIEDGEIKFTPEYLGKIRKKWKEQKERKERLSNT